jgi:hypothetical protein
MKNIIDFVKKNQISMGNVMTFVSFVKGAQGIYGQWNDNKQRKQKEEEEQQARIKHENKQQLLEDMAMVKSIFIGHTDEEIAFDLNMLDEDQALRLIDLYLKGKKTIDKEAVLQRQIINLASGTYTDGQIIDAFVTKSLNVILQSFLSKTEQECSEISDRFTHLPESNPWENSSFYRWLGGRYKNALTLLCKETNVIIRSYRFRGVEGAAEFEDSLQKVLKVVGQKNIDIWFDGKHEISILFCQWATDVSEYYKAFKACRDIKKLYDYKGELNVDRAVLFLENYIQLG